MPILRPIPLSEVPSVAEVSAVVEAVLHPRGRPLLPYEAGRDRVEVDPQGEVPDETVLAVTTTGSSGVPRTVLLSRACLLASATATLDRLGGPGGWTLALGMTHIAGIQVAIRAGLVGAPLVVCPPGGAGHVEAFAAATGRLQTGRRYTSLVPTQLRRLLDQGAAEALRAYDAILLGGAAADTRLLRDAAEQDVRVATTYGMTETSGGCVYDGVPLSRVGVEVDDGRITLTGPTVAVGYLGGPPFAGRFATSDSGRLAAGRLEVLGRTDAMINTGAQRVAPARVEAALLQLDGVEEAAVVGIPDREWGEIVVAVMAGSADPHGIRARLTDVLQPHELPRRVVQTAGLPRIGIGKVDYAAVRRLLESEVS